MALFLRLINLNQPFWLDEAIQALAVSRLSLGRLLTEFMPTDFNPPLSYLVSWEFGRLFGYSEVVLRLPSVIFGVLTVWLVYRLGGKLAALLLATSGLHLYYSQEARAYSLAALAVTASFYCLKKKNWVGYIVASLAAIYSHYLTVFIFPAQLVWVKKADWKKLWPAWMLIAVGYLPWLPVFFRQLAAGQAAAGTAWGGVAGSLSWKNVVLIPVKFLVGRISLDNNYIFAAVITVPLLAVAWALRQGVKQDKRSAAWLLIPTVLIILVSFWLPILSYFRLLFLLPAVYLLVVKGSEKIAWGLVGINLACSAIYLFMPQFHREDWRSLARELTDQPVVINAPVAAPLRYYYAGNNLIDTQAVPDSDFWYIPYSEPIFDPDLNFRQKADEAGFKESGVKQFRGGLTLIQYTR